MSRFPKCSFQKENDNFFPEFKIGKADKRERGGRAENKLASSEISRESPTHIFWVREGEREGGGGRKGAQETFKMGKRKKWAEGGRKRRGEMIEWHRKWRGGRRNHFHVSTDGFSDL